MKVLLDNSILTHSEFTEPALRRVSLYWGGRDCSSDVHGVVRKAPNKNTGYQRQIDSLFTIGRLIRTGRIAAYSYIEIDCERMRDAPKLGICNALRGCNIHTCAPAISRGKFRQTVDITDWMSKGGKKDIRRGTRLGAANQLAFLVWLRDLNTEQVGVLLSHRRLLGLTDFDIASFEDLRWFQFLCQRSGSSENYLDVFHLWTAQRNKLDAFLTLEETFQNIISNVKREKRKQIDIRAEVLRPLDLLGKVGIKEIDPVPMEFGQFYHLHEI
jgi:hypothetical protein